MSQQQPQDTNDDNNNQLTKFIKIIRDFTGDIETTFPELAKLLVKWKNDEHMPTLFQYCQKVYPERFLDIIYENEEIFQRPELMQPKEDESEEEFAARKAMKVYFLPGIDFRYIMNDPNISDKTKSTIWKYLQLILFSVVQDLNNSDLFGDTAKLFEALPESEFQAKIEETMQNLHSMFESVASNQCEGEGDDEKEHHDESTTEHTQGDSPQQQQQQFIPDAAKFQEHMNSILNGKLGKLAKEIAEETSEEFGFDFGFGKTEAGGAEAAPEANVKDMFKKLMKNPTKLLNMVKSIGSKLDTKMKSGEIKESEILEEITSMMKSMKESGVNFPGGDISDLQSMFKSMGGKGNMNMKAMQSMMQQRMKQAKMKERMSAKVQSNSAAATATATANATANTSQSSTKQQQPQMSDEEIIRIFSVGNEKQEKSMRRTKKN